MVRFLKNLAMKLMGLPTCAQVTEFAYLYLDGQLESRQLQRFERHLQGCKDCFRFVDSYREVARPERLTRPISMDPDFESRVIDFLIQERK